MVMTRQWFTAALALLVTAAVPELNAASLRAAAAKVDITPSSPQWLLGYQARQSTGVHDPLFHRVLVLDDGAAPMVLVSSDICVVSPAFYDQVAAQLERETGIGRARFWWLMTHTHSAPETGPPGLARSFMPDRYTHDYDHAYADRITRSLIDAVKQARATLKPAVLSVTTGWSSANINRRGRDPEGNISLGMNPDGAVDRQIGILRLTAAADGALIAVVANYAMHGTALGGVNLLISADAPGVVTSYVEDKLGTVMLYANGAAGNVAPIYSVQTMSGARLGEFKVLLGDRIIAAVRSMGSGTSDIRIQAAEQTVETPLRPGFHWDETLARYLATKDASAAIRLPVRFATIGSDVVLWAAPLELFCEVAMAVRNRSPFRFTFYYGYANGWLGYLPTTRAFDEGGYEIKTSPYTARAEGDLTEAVTTYISGLGQK
jgi:neutral ceramidase